LDRIVFDKYDKYGDYHWVEYAKPTIYRRHANFVARWVRERPVLDVGAGDGLICSLLSGVGIDSDPEAVRLAKARGVDVRLGDAYDLPFSSEFAAVILGDVIEHLEHPREALHQVRNVLIMGGVLYVATPPRRGKIDKYHYREYSSQELVKEISACGFECISMRTANRRIYGRFLKKEE